MTRIYTILLFLVFSITANAQYKLTHHASDNILEHLKKPDKDVKKTIKTICKVLKVKPIKIYEGNVPNAVATINKKEKPIIVYGKDFMEYMYLHNQWAPVSVLAHEIGHHVNYDISWYGAFKHPWDKELQADYVSGYVMQKLGVSIEDALSAFKVMFSWYGSNTHPDTPRRMDALSLGYLRASQGY